MSLGVNSRRMSSLCCYLKKWLMMIPSHSRLVPSPTDHLFINKIKSSLVLYTMLYIPRFSKLLCNSGLGSHHKGRWRRLFAIAHSYDPLASYLGEPTYIRWYIWFVKRKPFAKVNFPAMSIFTLWGLQELHTLTSMACMNELAKLLPAIQKP